MKRANEHLQAARVDEREPAEVEHEPGGPTHDGLVNLSLESGRDLGVELAVKLEDIESALLRAFDTEASD